MRALGLITVLACACGHPQGAPPEPTGGPAPPYVPPPVDAPAPPVVVDAVPVAAVVPDAAPPDADPAACWEQDAKSGRIVEVLRVRVTATGDESVTHGKESWGVQWAEATIVEVISGDMAQVDKRFRKTVYAITETNYRKKGEGHGWRPPDEAVAELIAAKDQERIVVMALPPQGADWNGIPARLRKKYGKLTPQLLAVCPVSTN